VSSNHYAPPRPQRQYVPGRVANRAGYQRRTIREPDWVAVKRFIEGERGLRLAAVDRDAAIDRLDSYGLSARQVALWLGVTQRTVQRRRSERWRQRILRQVAEERFGPLTPELERETEAQPPPVGFPDAPAKHREDLPTALPFRGRRPT
jgi:hypothetical protein